ncbi:MAG: hypothetical protein K0R77_2762 [Chryseobacterium sp.]|jgi:hypothetical protein|nr:hypothetical protein [Chryseobacterium sp.]
MSKLMVLPLESVISCYLKKQNDINLSYFILKLKKRKI